jgi:hypothetical protein
MEMEMRKMCVAALLLSVLGSTSANSATEDGQFATYSVGAQSCENILTAYRERDKKAVLLEVSSWLSGYITALNRVEKSVYDITPVMNHSALAMLTMQVCSANPNTLFEAVAKATIDAFSAVKIQQESNGVSLKNQQYSVVVRSSVIRPLQSILADQGYLDAEGADGVFGNNTSKAISEWQKANNKQVTGLFDPITIFGLLETIQ